MDYIQAIEKMRKELIGLVNQRCDDLIQVLQADLSLEGHQNEFERTLHVPSIFKGKKALAVKFASGEEFETSTWKNVVQRILEDCNNQPDKHEKLMRLRDSATGNFRTILGSSGEGMNVPLKIDEGLYFEGKFDTEALLTMLVKKVLEPVGYDYERILIRYAIREPIAIVNRTGSIDQNESGTDVIEEEHSLIQGM